jgi:hypothetical protein
MDLDDKYEVIGSGGFGKIIYKKDDDKVIKLIYTLDDCFIGEIEYKKHLNIYEKIKTLLSYNNSLQISTPKPIGFLNHKLAYDKNVYGCGYIMKYMPHLEIIDGLIHIIFKSEHKKIFNRLVGRKYNEEISKDNPSRGFFADIDYIEEIILPSIPSQLKKRIKDGNDISLNMGILYGTCIFGGKMMPIDAEYVLSFENNELTVSLIDYGMFSDLAYNIDEFISMRDQIEEIDLYFPYSDDNRKSYYENFIKGILSSALFFINLEEDVNTKNKLIKLAKTFII